MRFRLLLSLVATCLGVLFPCMANARDGLGINFLLDPAMAPGRKLGFGLGAEVEYYFGYSANHSVRIAAMLMKLDGNRVEVLPAMGYRFTSFRAAHVEPYLGVGVGSVGVTPSDPPTATAHTAWSPYGELGLELFWSRGMGISIGTRVFRHPDMTIIEFPIALIGWL